MVCRTRLSGLAAFLTLFALASLVGCSKPAVQVTQVDSPVSPDGLEALNYAQIETPEFDPTSYKEFEIPANSWAVGGRGDMIGIVQVSQEADARQGIGVLDTSSGESIVASATPGWELGTEIQSVRVSDSAIVWLEQNSLKSTWTLYLAPITREPLAMGEPVVVTTDHKTAFAAPGFDLVGRTVIWTQSASPFISSFSPALAISSALKQDESGFTVETVFEIEQGWLDSVSYSDGKISLAGRIPNDQNKIENRLVVLDAVDYRLVANTPLADGAKIAELVYAEGVTAWTGEYVVESGEGVQQQASTFAVQVIATPSDPEKILAEMYGNITIVGGNVYASDGRDVWCYLPGTKQKYRMPRLFPDSETASQDVATLGWSRDRLVVHSVENVHSAGGAEAGTVPTTPSQEVLTAAPADDKPPVRVRIYTL